MTESVEILFRPVGPEELELIERSGWRRFPPRLPEQPVFYPVVEKEYAMRIAREWNVRASGAGFVTRFAVDKAYLGSFTRRSAGGARFTEYWIPAEELDRFNEHIAGTIEVVAEFHAQEERSTMGEWAKAYDLADDRETVELVQRATQNTRDFGLESEVALYGSDAWWKAIEDGRIPKHEVHGIISRVYMTGHGDWPEFELDTGTEKTRWTRSGDQTLYQEGREAKVEYVLQKRRKPVLGQLEQKEVIRILVRLEASH